jgi:hypothetical protein
MLASRCATDLVGDWLYNGESTAIKSMRLFVKSVVEIFRDRYLRAPNEEDTTRLMQYSESIGFRGMLGSIDCMHWPWERCPTDCTTSLPVIVMIRQLSWRLSHHMICGFGTHTLGCPKAAMISMFCVDPHCLHG